MLRKRILVVDDDAAVRRAVRETLEREGFVVDEAASGEAAIESFRVNSPSLTIYDTDLAESGRPLRDWILSSDSSGTPALLLTDSIGDIKDEIRQRAAGAVERPVCADSLIEAVRIAMSGTAFEIQVPTFKE